MLPLSVQTLIDSYFRYLAESGINWTPRDVPADMRLGGPDEEELFQWQPVTSQISVEELESAARALGVEFGPQYSAVLQYRHFMELQIDDLNFFPHPSEGWKQSLAEHVLNGHPRELLLDRGMLPFAFCGDWGLYCFRLAEQLPSGEYAVYRWDHDFPQNFEPMGRDLFGTLLSLAASDA
jgi:hypothetical protein